MAINPKIKQKAEDIRSKIFGSEVRESLASGIESISEDVEATIGRQGYVEEQFQNVLDETTGKDVISAPELIAARNGKSNLKTRLDEEHAQVTAQLQQTTPEIFVEQFEKQVGELDDTGRIKRAVASLVEGQRLVLNKDYTVSDEIVLTKRNITLDFRGTIHYRGTNTCIMLTNYFQTLITPRIRREYGNSGKASDDLLYTAISAKNAKNFVIQKPDIEGFKHAIALHDSLGGGVAYGEIFTPILANNLVAIKTIRDRVESWVNEIKVYGGRITLWGGWSDFSGSAYFDLNGDNQQFFGVCAEGSQVERKIKGWMSYSNFIACRFEGSNGELDIELLGNNNNIIGCRGTFIHQDLGKRNNIQSQWKIDFGMAIAQKPRVFKATPTSFDITVNNENVYYLLDASAKQIGVTLPDPRTDKSMEYVPFTIKKTDNSPNNIIINVVTRTDHDIRAIYLKDIGETITLMSDGERYHVVNDFMFNTNTAFNGFDARTFQVGTKLKNSDYTNYTHTHRVCTQAGTNGSATITVTGTSGSNQVVATGETNKLAKGQYITIGTAGDFVIQELNGNTATLNSSLSANVTNQSLTFRPPVFVNVGLLT